MERRAGDTGREGWRADLPRRHDRDERQVEAAFSRPQDQVVEFVVIDTLERRHVEPDAEAELPRRFDAFRDAVELAPARDRRECAGSSVSRQPLIGRTPASLISPA